VPGAPGRGPAEHAAGPLPVAIDAGRQAEAEFLLPLSRGGVVTYRVLVLCDGAAELYTAVDPGGVSSSASTSKVLTVVGSGPGPGQARPEGLYHTG
jgi:hypothetical protein